MSLESATEFVGRLRFMNDLLESLRNADTNERERIIREAGYDFTIDELKQALGEYNEQLAADVAGGAGGAGQAPAKCRTRFCAMYSLFSNQAQYPG